MGVLDKFLDVMMSMMMISTMKMTILKMSHMKKRSQKRIFLERKINRLLTKKKRKIISLKNQVVQIKSPRCASLLHAEMLLQWKFV